MKVIKTSREFSKKETYIMTRGANMLQLKNVADGDELDYDGYLVFVDTDKEGNDNELVSVIGKDKTVWVFQSTTARFSLEEIANLMEDEPFTLIKTSGKSKAGREYVDLTMKVE